MQNSSTDKVAVVIVTYNRLSMLQKTVEAVCSQTYPPDFIIVVNNSSTDGTEEWLRNRNDVITITQPNTGGSGGFYTGFKTSFESGADWIWCMDDDVVPSNDCLENLLASSASPIRVPIRVAPSGELQFGTDTIRFNFTAPFAGLWKEMFSKEHLDLKHIFLEGPSFEGPLTHRSVVKSIGLPDKNFFIFADDSDFFIRANRAGFEAELLPTAKLHRLLPCFNKNIAPWKRYYELRNIIILDKRYGSFAVRLLRPILYVIKLTLAAQSNQERLALIKGFLHGVKRRMEQA